MAHDVKKMAEARKAEREATVDPARRQAVALEQIADTLESIRSEFAGFVHMVNSIARTKL